MVELPVDERALVPSLRSSPIVTMDEDYANTAHTAPTGPRADSESSRVPTCVAAHCCDAPDVATLLCVIPGESWARSSPVQVPFAA